MPAKSQDQQQAMAIAEHSPDKLYTRNASLLKMSKSQLSDFASTPTSGLPQKVKKTITPKSPMRKGNLKSMSKL